MSGLSSSGLRQRRKKEITQVLTDFDAFPKVPETYVEQTATGGYGNDLIILFTNININVLLYSFHHNIRSGDGDALLGAQLLPLSWIQVQVCSRRRFLCKTETQCGYDRGNAL